LSFGGVCFLYNSPLKNLIRVPAGIFLLLPF
jgi:hypothetical protein